MSCCCCCCCCCWVASFVADSVRPQRRQPTRLPYPWDSPGKNTGVVAISFSNARKWKVKVKSLSHVRLFATHGLQPTRLLCPWEFPGKSTGVGCHCLLHNNVLGKDKVRILTEILKSGLKQVLQCGSLITTGQESWCNTFRLVIVEDIAMQDFWGEDSESGVNCPQMLPISELMELLGSPWSAK